jgi:acetyltransferase-like isoleucine patch superfamily enzyme
MHLGERFYTEDELSRVAFRRLGRNVKIKRNAGLFFTENISIGDDTRIDDHTIIVASRESVSIGKNCHISAHCYVSGSDGFALDDFCTLSPGVLIFTSSDDYSGKKMTNVTLPKQFTGGPAGPVQLGRHVIVGAGTVILPGVEIGVGSAVGAQSLVLRSLEPWGIYAGSPVRRLRDRSRDLLELEREFLLLDEKERSVAAQR